jgi:hypothetical protein
VSSGASHVIKTLPPITELFSSNSTAGCIR